MKKFVDRRSAGVELAQEFMTRNYSDPVVLALPRGGVPVALEVARALKAPLDLVMVRKIGVPHQPEVAAGAVVNGAQPELVINDRIAAYAGLSESDLNRLAVVQLQEIKRRRAIYLKDREPVSVKGRTAIIVDDGIATGATIRAALKAVRRQKPLRLVLAVPVAAADTLSTLRDDVDDIICLSIPDDFYAIGPHYLDFNQVGDDEVVRLLAEAANILPEAIENP
jgi:putative phosphoribosyl transferase